MGSREIKFAKSSRRCHTVTERASRHFRTRSVRQSDASVGYHPGTGCEKCMTFARLLGRIYRTSSRGDLSYQELR